MKTTRPRFQSFKAKALEKPEVKAEYDLLKPIFEDKPFGKSSKDENKKPLKDHFNVNGHDAV